VQSREEDVVALDTFVSIVKLGRLIPHAVILVYVLGTLLAVVVGASFDIMKFLVGYVILLTGVLAAVYTNNYNDVATDRNATHTFFSGGSSILIDHPELMNITRYVAVSLYGVSILLGFLFTVVFSYPVTFFIYIVVGNVLGWCYTSPPVQLVYHGFGEMTTAIGAGFVIPGFAYYLMRGTIDAPFVFFSIPLMLFGFAISLYLELPDRDADRAGHKRTLVVRRGEHLGFLLGFTSACLLSFCFVFFALFPLFTVPFNFWIIAIFSVLPVIMGGWSLRKYAVDATQIVPIVFRAVISFFLVIILIDVYFVYVLLG
jgi:1,4-dihydroxy-2-naphthoate octaprenyltransferase